VIIARSPHQRPRLSTDNTDIAARRRRRASSSHCPSGAAASRFNPAKASTIRNPLLSDPARVWLDRARFRNYNVMADLCFGSCFVVWGPDLAKALSIACVTQPAGAGICFLRSPGENNPWLWGSPLIRGPCSASFEFACRIRRLTGRFCGLSSKTRQQLEDRGAFCRLRSQKRTEPCGRPFQQNHTVNLSGWCLNAEGAK